MEQPKVSVIIPTYKRSEMLPRAIKSVLDQTYQNIEIVVVDDNDPDTEWRKTTEKRMIQFKSDSRIVYVKHEKNKNGSAARNTGIAASTGKIITYLDDDDWYYPEKVEKQVKYLLTHPEHHAVYCGWRRFDDELPYGEGNLAIGILSGQNIIITNVIMMWKEDTINCGGWDNSLKRHQEAALLLNYFRYGGTFGRIPEILVEFDISDRSNAVAINGKNNENIICYLIDKYSDLLVCNNQSKKCNRAYVICMRYKGIFYNYIREKQIISAIYSYLKIVLRYPFYFNKVLIMDIFSRLKRV